MARENPYDRYGSLGQRLLWWIETFAQAVARIARRPKAGE